MVRPNVELPGRRYSVIVDIKNLADFEMQKKEWCSEKHTRAFWNNLDWPIRHC